MNKIYSALLDKKRKELSLVDEKISSALSEMPCALGEYFQNFLFKNAKRLRPLFAFLLCNLLEEKIDDNVLNFVSGIELLHSASLIHDDILDDAVKRRGSQCIHIKKSLKEGVLAGDYLLFLAVSFILKTGCEKALKTVSNAGYLMTKSEIRTLENRYKEPDLETYRQTIKEKTSSLFLAILEGISEIKNIKIDRKIYDFAENFSLIFQLRDDLNNYMNLDNGKTASDKDFGIYTLPEILKFQNHSCDIIEDSRFFILDLIKNTEDLLREYPKNADMLALLNVLKEEQ